MQTLTDFQKTMATTLIDWTQERTADGESPLIDEGEFATAIGQMGWRRSNVDDLNMLSAYCDRKGYPPISLLVVIPGLMKPEKSLLIHAFKATLPPAEFTKRWKAALEEIQATPNETWEAFRADIESEE